MIFVIILDNDLGCMFSNLVDFSQIRKIMNRLKKHDKK